MDSTHFALDAFLTIKGIQRSDGEDNVVELMTCGKLYRRNGVFYLSYDETELTGYSGSKTLLKIEKNDKITMTRSGNANAQLIIERGRRHQCVYDTGFGSMTIGVSGDKILAELDEKGGLIDFSYSMDMNTALTSENRVIITVKESAVEC